MRSLKQFYSLLRTTAVTSLVLSYSSMEGWRRSDTKGLTVGPDSDIASGKSLIFCFSQKEVAMIRKIAQLFVGFALLTPVILYAQNTRQPASAQTPPVNSSADTAKQKSAGPKMTD